MHVRSPRVVVVAYLISEARKAQVVHFQELASDRYQWWSSFLLAVVVHLSSQVAG